MITNFLSIILIGITLSSCDTYTINSPCDCVKKQIDMLDRNEPNYGETFGLCEQLKQDKTQSEINILQQEYEKCPGYERLKKKYMSFVKDILENLDSKDGIDQETIDVVLKNLKNQ